MYSLVRPILFRFDAEKAHHFTLNSLRSIEKLGLLPKVNSNTRPTELMGLQLPNPVGLAAGWIKTASVSMRLPHWVSALSKSAR